MIDPQTHPHYESTPYRYPSKKDKIQQKQGEKVKQMLNQVNTILDHLLKDLSYLYKANGINYCTEHYHHTLVRILTPFQLLSHFQVADNQDLFNFEDIPQTNQNIFSDLGNDNQAIMKKQQLCFTPGFVQTDLQDRDQGQIKQKERKKTNRKCIYRKERAKPILNYQTQCILAEWAFQKLKQNKMVRRKDLAKKAVQLYGNKQGFYGSIGWVSRFLNRQPKLKQQLTKVARNNLGKRLPDYENSQLDQQQINYQRFSDENYFQPRQKNQLKNYDKDKSHQPNENEQSLSQSQKILYYDEKDNFGFNYMEKIEVEKSNGTRFLTGKSKDDHKRAQVNKMIANLQSRKLIDQSNQYRKQENN